MKRRLRTTKWTNRPYLVQAYIGIQAIIFVWTFSKRLAVLLKSLANQTQTDFIICPMLYAIAMGHNKNIEGQRVKSQGHSIITY